MVSISKMRFYYVWGFNGAGEKIDRRLFVSSLREAKRKFELQTGIKAEGAEEA